MEREGKEREKEKKKEKEGRVGYGAYLEKQKCTCSPGLGTKMRENLFFSKLQTL